MKLIKPSYKILTSFNGERILADIELAARTCYQSEGKIEYRDAEVLSPQIQYAKSARPLITKLISLGHEAMLEFGGMITVRFICDRGVSHELVRHRIASFAQESTRYCNYKDKDISFIIPPWFTVLQERVIRAKEYEISDNGIEFVNELGENITNELINIDETLWLIAMHTSEHLYHTLINSHKWLPQEARSVLPNSLKTEINVSANIREWRHIFKLRTAKTAHIQMRELMQPLLDEFKSKIPILFDDINY